MNRVSVVGGVTDVDAAVRRSVDLLGGMSIKPSGHVVIKPNICNAKNPGGIVITDFRVIKAVVEIVRELASEITLVESDNISGSAEKRAKESGFLELCDEQDVGFLNLSHDDYEEYPVAGAQLRLPRTVLDADYFINLPKIKTCAQTLVTLGIKNLYGVFQRKQKGRLHKYLNDILPFLVKTVRNDMIIVDGINCMEGNGPVIGNPLCLNLIVAGNNLVSVDSVCSRIMGYDPNDIQHIALSHSQGVGEIDLKNVEIVGDDWKKYVQSFEPPHSLKASLKSLKAIREINLGN
jgi:uncharacterized protein (DUF362 family)